MSSKVGIRDQNGRRKTMAEVWGLETKMTSQLSHLFRTDGVAYSFLRELSEFGLSLRVSAGSL